MRHTGGEAERRIRPAGEVPGVAAVRKADASHAGGEVGVQRGPGGGPPRVTVGGGADAADAGVEVEVLVGSGGGPLGVSEGGEEDGRHAFLEVGVLGGPRRGRVSAASAGAPGPAAGTPGSDQARGAPPRRGREEDSDQECSWERTGVKALRARYSGGPHSFRWTRRRASKPAAPCGQRKGVTDAGVSYGSSLEDPVSESLGNDPWRLDFKNLPRVGPRGNLSSIKGLGRAGVGPVLSHQ